MIKRILFLLLACIFIVISITYSEVAAKPTYSKTLEKIYKSKNVYKDTETRLAELNKNYRSITSLFRTGLSVQKSNLTVLKVGKGPKKIFINASHHPREYMGTILTLNQIQYILEAYATNDKIDGYNIRTLLDKEVSFYFQPLVNPDGVQICVNGSPAYYFNANKVDLNHNYDALWYKDISKSYSTGPYAFSEPETQAVKLLCENVEFELTVAYHAAGDIIYWYFGQQGAAKQRDLAYANMLKNLTGYALVSPANYKESTSGFKDWCVMKLKIPSFTLEIGGKRGLSKPVEWSLYSSVWQKNKLVPVKLAKQLLKQGTYKGDKVKALVYKGTLISLRNPIIVKDEMDFISLEDALALGLNSLSPANQDKVIQTEIAVKNSFYISLPTFSKQLGLSYSYDTAVNTFYIGN